MTDTDLTKTVLEKIRQNTADRDKELKNYFKSIMGTRKYSVSQACRMCVEHLFKKGYYSITTEYGVRKRLTVLGMIKTD